MNCESKVFFRGARLLLLWGSWVSDTYLPLSAIVGCSISKLGLCCYRKPEYLPEACNKATTMNVEGMVDSRKKGWGGIPPHLEYLGRLSARGQG